MAFAQEYEPKKLINLYSDLRLAKDCSFMVVEWIYIQSG
jgi:hypothetical protein